MRLFSDGWVVLPRPSTPEAAIARVHSGTMAGRLGKLGWAHALGQVTDEEYLERKRLIDLLDGYGWHEPSWVTLPARR